MGSGLVTVSMPSVGPVMMGAAVTSTPTHSSSGAPTKKKRSLTEDESETDQMPMTTKEEDPWSLADHIDGSSDYIDPQIAGKYANILR